MAIHTMALAKCKNYVFRLTGYRNGPPMYPRNAWGNNNRGGWNGPRGGNMGAGVGGSRGGGGGGGGGMNGGGVNGRRNQDY